MNQKIEVVGCTGLVDAYLSGWNEVDPGERAAIVEQCWGDECALVDPPREGRGHAGVHEMIEALHAHYPHHRFVRVGEVEEHHDAFRVRWELRGPDGAAALTGTDYGLVGPDGRLTRVTGFFELPVGGAA